MVKLPDEPLTHSEFVAVASGENLDEYRAKAKVRQRIQDAAKQYIETSPEHWPDISFNWDLSDSSQRYALDGCSESEFSEHYPNGFVLGTVKLKDFDRILWHFSRRDEGELWEVGFSSKLAFLIAYLSEGLPISPPLVKPVPSGEVGFAGGHHRYAVAKAVGLDELPIYVELSDLDAISNLLAVRWDHDSSQL